MSQAYANQINKKTVFPLRRQTYDFLVAFLRKHRRIEMEGNHSGIRSVFIKKKRDGKIYRTAEGRFQLCVPYDNPSEIPQIYGAEASSVAVFMTDGLDDQFDEQRQLQREFVRRDKQEEEKEEEV